MSFKNAPLNDEILNCVIDGLDFYLFALYLLFLQKIEFEYKKLRYF